LTVTDQQRAADFEGRLEEAVWSYSHEGVRTFDAAAIAAQARSARSGVLGWRPPMIGDRRALRLVLLAALVAAAALAIALAGSRRTDTPLPLPGVIVVGAGDQLVGVDVGSGAVQQLTPKTPHDANPAWSPDGRHIAFTSHDGRGPVQMVDADGTNRRVLTPGFGAGTPAVWSPDGTRIAFGGYRYPPVADRGLWIVSADGTGLTRLVSSDPIPGRLAWSPDGSMIAFSRGDAGVAEVVDVATGAITGVGNPMIDQMTDAAPLAWQPGRTALLYSRDGRGDRHDLVLAERTGGRWAERPIITDLAPGKAAPAWLDRDRFVFVSWDLPPGGRPVVARADGTIERVLGDGGIEPWTTGCVAPDGSAVAYPVTTSVDSDGNPSANGLVVLPTDGRPATRIPTARLGSADVAPCSWRLR